MLKKLLLAAVVTGALVVPAVPAQATTCSAQDPTVELVLCDVVWDTVAPLTCNVELWCD